MVEGEDRESFDGPQAVIKHAPPLSSSLLTIRMSFQSHFLPGNSVQWAPSLSGRSSFGWGDDERLPLRSPFHSTLGSTCSPVQSFRKDALPKPDEFPPGNLVQRALTDEHVLENPFLVLRKLVPHPRRQPSASAKHPSATRPLSKSNSDFGSGAGRFCQRRNVET